VNSAIERVIECQERLIEALDMRDASAVEAAATELAGALSALSQAGAVYGLDADRLDHAVRQTEAARVRVNLLASWTRQRIDRLSEIRSGSYATYGKKAAFAPVC
jgi:hypothetical protein